MQKEKELWERKEAGMWLSSCDIWLRFDTLQSGQRIFPRAKGARESERGSVKERERRSHAFQSRRVGQTPQTIKKRSPLPLPAFKHPSTPSVLSAGPAKPSLHSLTCRHMQLSLLCVATFKYTNTDPEAGFRSASQASCGLTANFSQFRLISAKLYKIKLELFAHLSEQNKN